ncbi:MAG: hypothetical protein DI536_00210 [Archangium gephyra]|uniref:Uncharacterized protein n=1 Tax=Archangium gephyra TaxID=48 RepID=A0A2W5VRN5_9BACT|nr:MAG: hypothetical protein DI536_00210 [Archangium gephyra]
MPVVFNPFNPMSYVNARGTAVNNAALGAPRVSKGTPIPVEAKSENPGIKLKSKTLADGSVEVSFAGKAKAAKVIQPTGVYADMMEPTKTNNTVSLKVAVNEAVTTDSFGATNYTEKNKRGMFEYTSEGETGRQLANDFAKRVNQLGAFRATVKPGATADAATLIISRR